MPEFKKIETQDELDVIVKNRLARQKEEFESQIHELEQTKEQNVQLQASLKEATDKSAAYDQNISDLNSKITGYETAKMRTQIALKNGLPFDLADRLVGDDEESITADAQRLSGLVNAGSGPVPPIKDPEPKPNENSVYQNILDSLEENGEN